jgi:hypothetical protein
VTIDWKSPLDVLDKKKQSLILDLLDEFLIYLLSESKLFASISFALNSMFRRIKSYAFSSVSPRLMIVQRNVEIIGSFCIRECNSRSSHSLEPGSVLTRIEFVAFPEAALTSICLPGTVQFGDAGVFSDLCEISER